MHEFSRAVKADDTQHSIYVKRAMAYLESNEFQAALDDLGTALSLDSRPQNYYEQRDNGLLAVQQKVKEIQDVQ